mmetsp:Transcript_31087/g.72293  ORF Transcript_31087/g.72293 Transcript_31087/m.72293 type:complete len:310 (-) Transcript_31087:707-1636(-)
MCAGIVSSKGNAPVLPQKAALAPPPAPAQKPPVPADAKYSCRPSVAPSAKTSAPPQNVPCFRNVPTARRLDARGRRLLELLRSFPIRGIRRARVAAGSEGRGLGLRCRAADVCIDLKRKDCRRLITPTESLWPVVERQPLLYDGGVRSLLGRVDQVHLLRDLVREQALEHIVPQKFEWPWDIEYEHTSEHLRVEVRKVGEQLGVRLEPLLEGTAWFPTASVDDSYRLGDDARATRCLVEALKEPFVQQNVRATILAEIGSSHQALKVEFGQLDVPDWAEVSIWLLTSVHCNHVLCGVVHHTIFPMSPAR